MFFSFMDCSWRCTLIWNKKMLLSYFLTCMSVGNHYIFLRQNVNVQCQLWSTRVIMEYSRNSKFISALMASQCLWLYIGLWVLVIIVVDCMILINKPKEVTFTHCIGIGKWKSDLINPRSPRLPLQVILSL